MKKNAKLAPLQTSLRHVAILFHNADFPNLRVTKTRQIHPQETDGFALGTGKNVIFTIALVSSLSAMDWDMFLRLMFLSVLFWLDLPVLDFVKNPEL